MGYVYVDKLKHIRFMCHKILPLVYDESLSYYETLCKFAFSLNETITSVNELNDNVGYINDNIEYIAKTVSDVAKEIDTFEASVEKKFTDLTDAINKDVNDAIDDMQKQVQGEIADINNELDSFKEYIDSEYAVFETKVNALIEKQIEAIDAKFGNLEESLRLYIYTEFQRIIDEIPEITSVTIIDPTSGKLTDIQYVINNLFNFVVRDRMLNCEELDSLRLTAYEIDNYEVDGVLRGLTAFEWDSDTKKIFGWVDDKDKVREYITGEKVILKNNVDINNNLLRYSGCFTASEWADNLTVEQIDANLFTVDKFDWNSNHLVAIA